MQVNLSLFIIENSTLCAQFGKECRNIHFLDKTTVAEPGTTRTMREGKCSIIHKNGCDWPKNITEHHNKTSQAQLISPTHPEEVDKSTFDI